MSDDKAREFWVDNQTFVHGKHKTSADQCFNCMVVMNPKDKSGDYTFHVIEYSAVEKLEAQVKELRGDLSKQIAVKTESIGLYGLTLEERDQYKAASEKLAKYIHLMRAQAGIPEPIDACRAIIKTGNEALAAHEKFKASNENP